MKSLGHALRIYRNESPNSSLEENKAFIAGWTAKEVALVYEGRNGVICADIIRAWLGDHCKDGVITVNKLLLFIEQESK